MPPSSAPRDADVVLHLHAELLPNIRQVTLYVTLPRLPALEGVQPQIQLSESCKSVTVSLPEPWNHVSETLKLPARVASATRQNTNLRMSTPSTPAQPADSGLEYSLRMMIHPSDVATATPDVVSDEYVPWTAADMTPLTRMRCRGCGTPFMKDGGSEESVNGELPSVRSEWLWKDLPSGNWAEMMDFWHCHKPDPHEHDPKSEADAALKLEGETAQMKGFGAASRVEAIPGTVLIDVASFLLSEADCTNLNRACIEGSETGNATSPLERSLQCTKCEGIVGMDDPSARGWRLLKAHLSLSHDPTSPSVDEATWDSPPVQLIVAAQLLELIERESARRFVVHRGQKQGLLLWVFNPDLRYSNSGSDYNVSAQQAMKVLYQTIQDVDVLLTPEIGNPSPLSVEELELPAMIYGALEQALRESSEILPSTARQFNKWKVGLLHRFSRIQV
ncbi:hypothetical protein POX_g09008 [Penicillium oxalicum]|uniref:hypothetical protein n=1 Tax=Penicillium oxalicum TaxID=69781 RepID=UPI0020B86865|nr:hypothetical protein POX_g09008 [Penicillium oxalicum]KAI2786620.1 hypothetical protein POX_g09008 [Penicillium oxalicum]